MCFQADDKGLDCPAKSQKTKQEKVFLTEEINHQPETAGQLNRNPHDSQVLWLSSFLHREISDVCSLSLGHTGGELVVKRLQLGCFFSIFCRQEKLKGPGAVVKAILGSSLWGPEA